MMKKSYIFFALILTNLLGQSFTGLVKDISGEPIPYVIIKEINSNVDEKNWVITDFNGVFTINASNTAQLSFERIGFKKVSLAINEIEGKSIVLLNEDIELEAVQVYGSNNDQYLKLKNSYTCILDEEPKKGPLGGIYSVLNQLESDVIFFAVDMPESYPLYEPLVKREGNVCFTLNNKIQSLPLKLSSNTKEEVFLNIQNNNLKLKSYIESIKCNIIEVQGNKCLLNVNNFCILNV